MSKTIEISDDLYKELESKLCNDSCFKEIDKLEDLVGKNFFFRTVTYHMTGKVKKIVGDLIYLEDAAWIADSGRFMQAIKDGKLNEVEPVGEWFINISTVTDFGPWKHKLPTEQK